MLSGARKSPLSLPPQTHILDSSLTFKASAKTSSRCCTTKFGTAYCFPCTQSAWHVTPHTLGPPPQSSYMYSVLLLWYFLYQTVRYKRAERTLFYEKQQTNSKYVCRDPSTLGSEKTFLKSRATGLEHYYIILGHVVLN